MKEDGLCEPRAIMISREVIVLAYIMRKCRGETFFVVRSFLATLKFLYC